MNLITQEWRLKLLAFGLSVLMLGAVAFSQSNIRTLQVNISYVNLPQTAAGLPKYGLIAPLDRIALSVSAPSDLPVTAASVTATADLSHIKKGPAVSIPIQVHTTDLRIVVQSPPAITVNVDDWSPSVPLAVQVRTPNQATGWAVTSAFARCGASNNSCVVLFSGPASVATGLGAFVTINDQIQEQSWDSLNLPLQFEQNGRSVDVSKVETLPSISIQPPTVNAHVDAKQGTATVQVTLLDDTPTHYPPAAYRVTSVTVSPLTIACTGLPANVSSLITITLPGVDLSHSTSNVTFKVQVPIPAAGVRCTPSIANVTYSISPNPSTQASPSPTPT